MKESNSTSAGIKKRMENLTPHTRSAEGSLDKTPIAVKVPPELRDAWRTLPGEKVNLLRQAIIDIVGILQEKK